MEDGHDNNDDDDVVWPPRLCQALSQRLLIVIYLILRIILQGILCPTPF